MHLPFRQLTSSDPIIATPIRQTQNKRRNIFVSSSTCLWETPEEAQEIHNLTDTCEDNDSSD